MTGLRKTHSKGISVFTCLLLLTCGCRRESDATLQERLVGTWRYAKSDGAAVAIPSDLTFTVTRDGSYSSKVTMPQSHAVEGTAEIKNGFLMVTVTKCDATNVVSPIVDRQAIIQFDEKGLVTRSEGSSIKNYFRKP
jgi:hypothetical protein